MIRDLPLHYPAGQQAGIQVAGNSGCHIKLQARGSSLIIEKTAADAAYSPRLKLQIAKQKQIVERGLAPFIRVPLILAEREEGGVYAAEMQYLCFQSSIEFFASASRPAIDTVAGMLFAFVDAEVAASSIRRVPRQLFVDKIESVASYLKTAGKWSRYEACVYRLSKAVAARECFDLPVGECHGDLTFSNVMISSDGSAVGLIDFLDSFIESPLADIAKLRQDTRFHWTKMFGVDVEAGTRFSQVMNYLDALVDRHFSARQWYAENIDIMLFLNMLRIAPYVKSEAVEQFIIDSTQSIRLKND